MTRIVLATDNDEPGQALAEELARRLGRERCLLVRWPQGAESVAQADGHRSPGYLKDANEVLVNGGAEALRECVANADPYPIRGLFRCSMSVMCLRGAWQAKCVCQLHCAASGKAPFLTKGIVAVQVFELL